jgi:hypothetical protein
VNGAVLIAKGVIVCKTPRKTLFLKLALHACMHACMHAHVHVARISLTLVLLAQPEALTLQPNDQQDHPKLQNTSTHCKFRGPDDQGQRSFGFQANVPPAAAGQSTVMTSGAVQNNSLVKSTQNGYYKNINVYYHCTSFTNEQDRSIDAWHGRG